MTSVEGAVHIYVYPSNLAKNISYGRGYLNQRKRSWPRPDAKSRYVRL